MHTTTSPSTERISAGAAAPPRRRLRTAAALLACIALAGCPSTEEGLAKTRAREAQLNRDLAAATKRGDTDEILRISRELQDIRDIYRRLAGDVATVNAGTVIARYPVADRMTPHIAPTVAAPVLQTAPTVVAPTHHH